MILNLTCQNKMKILISFIKVNNFPKLFSKVIFESYFWRKEVKLKELEFSHFF